MQNEKIKVRISDIIYVIIKNKRFIAVCALLGLFMGVLLSALGYIRGEMTKQYKITASAAVTAKIENGNYSSRYTDPNKDDLSVARDMTDAAMYVVSSDMAIKATIERMEMVGVSSKSIKSNLKLTQYNETQIIEMELKWRSEEEGVRILETLTEVSDDILLETLNIGNLSVVNSPSATYIFGGNIKITTIVYVMVFGILIGVVVVIIKMLAYPKLMRSDDMDALFGLEIMGKVPYNIDFADASPFDETPDVEKNEIAAAARILTNRLAQADVNRIYFTSTQHGEGKTKIAAELAAKIADFGKKVLLVDCDFHNPSLASQFNITVDYEHSMNALYKGDCDENDAVIRISGCLYLLSCVLEEKAVNMYDALPQILPQIFMHFDYVLIDSEPIGKNSEIIMLNEISQAAFFIVKYDEANLADIRKSLLQLSKSGIPTAGCIVNGTKTWRNIIRDAEKLAKKAKRKRKKKKKQKAQKKQKAKKPGRIDY